MGELFLDNNLNADSFISNTSSIDDLSDVAKAAFTQIEHHSMIETVFFILYLVVALLSLLVNIIILIVIIRRRRMRIVENYFLANINVANLMYTFCAPLHFLNVTYGRQMIYFDVTCQLLPFFSTLSINLNTFTMIAASFERLSSIVFPFNNKMTKQHCIFIIFFMWLLAILVSIPWILLLQVEYINTYEIIREMNQSNENTTTVEKILIAYITYKEVKPLGFKDYLNNIKNVGKDVHVVSTHCMRKIL